RKNKKNLKKGVDIGGESGIMTFVDPTEATRSGIEEVITSTIGNRVTAKNRPRVRIPPTPPKPRTLYVRGFPFFRHGLPQRSPGWNGTMPLVEAVFSWLLPPFRFVAQRPAWSGS